METSAVFEGELNLKATELRLGLPGADDVTRGNERFVRNNKRSSPETAENARSEAKHGTRENASAPKAQVVGWPPIGLYRKNSFQHKKTKTESGRYVKVSMDGAPYLRKIDLKVYSGYSELVKALENMFKLTNGVYTKREGYKVSEYATTYEDKDGDLMLVGDVPWEMFISTCRRLRIMRGSEAKGLTSEL